MKFGQALRQKRLQDGALQAKICEQLQVSKSTYILWEKGRNLPKVDKFDLLSGYLQVSMDELVQMMIK